VQVARALRFATTSAFALALVATAMPARADARAECLAASEKAQQSRNSGKLSEAREQLAICGRAECPKLIQQDCAQWMSEVLAVLPSVVPGARDKRGRDIVDVKLSIDGKVVTEALDGKPLPVDPGVHVFKFETKGAPALDEKIVVRQGEKNRIVTVTFAIGDAPDNATGKKPGAVDVGHDSDRRDGRDRGGSSPPIAAFIVGGLGLVALGTALYINLDANADARKLRDECAPKCNPADVDDVEQRRIIAGVTAAAGGALLIAGVVLFLVHNSGDSRGSRANGPTFAVAPITGGAFGAAAVSF
jgi:hypothetical protein